MFHPSSFWNQELPTGLPVDPNSAGYVASLVEAVGKGTDLNFDDWSLALFTAGPNTPTAKVTLDQKPEGESIDMQLCFNVVPIPSNLRPPGPFVATTGTDGDHHTEIIWRRADGQIDLFGFWKLRQFEVDGPNGNPGVPEETLHAPGWHAKYGMCIQDIENNTTGSFVKGTSFPGTTHGRLSTTASGLPCAPGVIRIAEAQRAAAGVVDAIRHPLIFTAGSKAKISNQFRWPALKTDGESAGASSIQEGMRFFLPRSFDLSTVADPFMRSVCWTLQHFGTIVVAVGGSVAFKCETQATRRGTPEYAFDGWKGPEGKFGGAGAVLTHKPSVLMAEVPWAQMQVVHSEWRPLGSAKPVLL